jgi:hypothetical protein
VAARGQNGERNRNDDDRGQNVDRAEIAAINAAHLKADERAAKHEQRPDPANRPVVRIPALSQQQMDVSASAAVMVRRCAQVNGLIVCQAS